MNKDFKVYKLGDVTKIFAGGDKPAEFSDVKTEDYKFPIYANGETNSGLQGFAKVAKVNESAVTVSARGTIGFAALRMEPFVPIVRLLTLIPDAGKIDLVYLYYYLKLYRQSGIGSSQAQLIAPEISNRTISLPNLPIQKSIGKVLSVLDAKIELNNRINTELESMAKSLYDYWFVQFDFPNKDGKPYKTSGGKMVWSEELKREIPEDWEVIKVEKLLLKESSQIKTPSSEYELCGKIPIIDQSTDFIAGYTNNQNATIDGNVIPRIVFGDHTRILKLINFDFVRGADGTQVLLSNNKRIPQHVLYHSLLRIDLSNYGYARHFKFLKDSLVILPDFNVANAYERRCTSFYNLIKENIFQNIKLAEIRDWLLPMLMNGQVKVN